MKTKSYVFLTILFISPILLAQDSFDWSSNTFYGMGEYFALRPDTKIKKGDSLLVLGRSSHPDPRARVIEILDSAPAKKEFEEKGFEGVYSDEPLYQEIGWYWSFKGPDEPKRVARMSTDGAFAIAGVGPNALVLECPNKTYGSPIPTLPSSETESILNKIKPVIGNKSCLGKSSIVKGIRYGPVRTHEIVELMIGNPTYLEEPTEEGSTMASIEICEALVADGALLRIQELKRSSSEEERVDSGPPTLNEDWWYATSDQTLGYLSLDGGKTWKRAIQNNGFEGIVYRIEDAKDGNEVFSAYHYTPH